MSRFVANPLWSQHFFRDPARAASVVAQLPLTRRDTVYEIGPGTGLLTAPLAERVGRVVAVEVDPALCARLRARFAAWPNVRVVHADFLHYPLPTEDYRVVSNVPFGVTAAVLAKLLRAPSPPRAAHLIVQTEAAERCAGTPRETQYSVLAKPWFALAIEREFARAEFVPVPRVGAALLAIRRRDNPLVPQADAALYRAFVRYGFGRWRKDLKTGFRGVFSNLQFKTLARTLHFPLDATPTALTFDQWLGLFRYFQTGVPLYKQQALVARVRDTTGPATRRGGVPIFPPLPRPPPRWRIHWRWPFMPHGASALLFQRVIGGKQEGVGTRRFAKRRPDVSRYLGAQEARRAAERREFGGIARQHAFAERGRKDHPRLIDGERVDAALFPESVSHRQPRFARRMRADGAFREMPVPAPHQYLCIGRQWIQRRDEVAGLHFFAPIDHRPLGEAGWLVREIRLVGDQVPAEREGRLHESPHLRLVEIPARMLR